MSTYQTSPLKGLYRQVLEEQAGKCLKKYPFVKYGTSEVRFGFAGGHGPQVMRRLDGRRHLHVASWDGSNLRIEIARFSFLGVDPAS
jgi:hypothetical protein